MQQPQVHPQVRALEDTNLLVDLCSVCHPPVDLLQVTQQRRRLGPAAIARTQQLAGPAAAGASALPALQSQGSKPRVNCLPGNSEGGLGEGPLLCGARLGCRCVCVCVRRWGCCGARRGRWGDALIPFMPPKAVEGPQMTRAQPLRLSLMKLPFWAGVSSEGLVVPRVTKKPFRAPHARGRPPHLT